MAGGIFHRENLMRHLTAIAFSALTLLVGGRKGIRRLFRPVKNMGGWWRWALVSPDGVAPSRRSVCLPVLIFPCTIKSRSSLLAPAHPGRPRKRGVKRLCVCVWLLLWPANQNAGRQHVVKKSQCQSHWVRCSVKCPFMWKDLDPHLVHSSLGFHRLSRFCRACSVTDRLTDRPHYSVCSNRLHPASAAMWPKIQYSTDEHNRALTSLAEKKYIRPVKISLPISSVATISQEIFISNEMFVEY